MAVVELRERSQARAKQTVTELLQELRIEHLRTSPAVSLSGGERRRVEIARALASEPSFMLLDEPFAGIDPLAIADIREVITYLKGRGIGILITDHNVRETLDIIDRASIIHAGEVLFEGTPDQIVDDPEVRRVYLGERFAPGDRDVPAYAAPARADDVAGLPPAFVAVMEFDPLRDEGILYAMKLMAAGVPVELHAYPGTFHGSSLIDAAAISREAPMEKWPTR